MTAGTSPPRKRLLNEARGLKRPGIVAKSRDHLHTNRQAAVSDGGVGRSFQFPGIRKGRENRPQLRCGIASQTHTAPPGGAGKANRGSHPGEGEGRGKVRSAVRPGGRHMRSPNTSPGNSHPPGAIARAGRETFIAKVKHDSA